MSVKRKIAYITGTRSDFGLMTPVLRAIEQSEKLSLELYALGTHLMPQFGNTLELVRGEFPSAQTIDAGVAGSTSAATANFISDVLAKVTSVFETNRPDLVLLLGDRPEMLAIATACLYLGIPTAHLHGGERTGTADEVARHAITKLSSLHLPATKDAAERIERMGEEASRIHTVGAPALDVILGSALPSREDVAAFIGISVSEKFALLVQHPSEESSAAGKEMEETLTALKTIALPIVAVYPNADAGSEKMIAALEKERGNPLFHIFTNIPYMMFLALERDAAVWVGNSSAACIESASFKTPVVNIGERQRGRLCGKNVINAPHDRTSIAGAVEKALHDKDYRSELPRVSNPWGDGTAGPRVASILEDLVIDPKLLHKQISY
ncbi:MAG: UDP-N-acetylglucosamine 2-epimerase [bacterium]|nr:UDP-N-acetylglucosamine 2-epimerase [bacterium]